MIFFLFIAIVAKVMINQQKWKRGMLIFIADLRIERISRIFQLKFD